MLILPFRGYIFLGNGEFASSVGELMTLIGFPSRKSISLFVTAELYVFQGVPIVKKHLAY